ncbi:hypothetical protein Tco_0511082 [Tanacetum coccineum]
MASMPSVNPMLVDLNEMEKKFKTLFELLEKNSKRESIFYTSLEELRLIDVCVQAKLILRNLHTYFEVFQNRFKRVVNEMKDNFVSVENDLDKTIKQNELLKDRLLKASLAEDIKNIVIISCEEIRNKDLHDETERISNESKDVSNKSKTADTHKSRENNSLKSLQKENENFMASLQIKNAHLKQTYKDLFESIQRSRVETNHCDEVKVKVDDSKAEKDQFLKEINHLRTQFENLKGKSVKTKFGKSSILGKPPAEKLLIKSQLLKSWFTPKIVVQKDLSKPVTAQSLPKNEKDQLLKQIASLESKLASQDIRSCQKEYHELRTSYNALKIDELKKSLAKQTKENSDLLMKIDNLENVFADEEKRATFGKWNAFDKENCDFGSKNTKFEAYFEKLKNTKVVLERKLARKVDDSKAEKNQFLKEINHLRTQLENLKGKFVKTKFGKSSILGKPPTEKLLIKSQLSKSWFTPKIVVQKDLSKPVTAQSLPKNEKDQLLKQIASLESKLASQDIRSCQKEYHELRTSYNALKVKFDSLNRKK